MKAKISLAPNPAAPPTLVQVARAAGLSPMTVSRALNTPHLVRPHTVEKVLEAVRLTGYIPNAAAGSLASRKSRLIAVVVPQINNNMFVDVIQSLNDELTAYGYHMLLCVSGYEETTEAEIATALLSRRPDGVVLTGVHHSQGLRRTLLQASIPVVEIWDMTATPIDMLVGFSHESVGVCLAQHIVRRGYRRPALIWTDDRRAAQRRDALVATLGEHGTPVVGIKPVPLPAALRSGRQAFEEIWQQDLGADVIVCSSDTLAQGAMMAAQSKGLSIPDDTAFIGFGDLDFAACNFPSITTVRIDRTKLGQAAATSLMGRLAGEKVNERIIDIGFEIMERDSG